MCTFESQSEARYYSCIVVDRSEVFFKKFTSMIIGSLKCTSKWAILERKMLSNFFIELDSIWMKMLYLKDSLQC